MAPGLLHVTMDPAESLSDHEFHDWYNNEHGPTRLRLAFFATGMRYASHRVAITSPSPPWLAIYDVTNMDCLETQEYLRLRSPPVKSEREVDVMKQIRVNRRLLTLINDHRHKKEIDHSNQALVEVQFKINPNSDADIIEEKSRKTEEEAETAFAWDRVACYRSESEIVVHCRLASELLDTDEVQSALKDFFSSIRQKDPSGSATLRLWRPHYKFGPAPRHLSQGGNIWVHQETRTVPAASSPTRIPAVESYTVLQDGLSMPYRLEGSSDPNAPVICLVNSVMVHWDIWDEFIAAFFSHKGNAKYRILRFAPRGRLAPDRCSVSPKVTVDLLVEDIVGLLKALLILRVECIMGVSLGGATALRAGLLYPEVFRSFVACDTNAASPPGNAGLWAARIAIAEKEGATVVLSTGSEAVIGEDLANVTVKRWAAPMSLDDPEIVQRLHRVKEGVKTSSLEGFKQQVRALYEYDFWDDMKAATTRGTFLVGAHDGKLPDGMKKMAEGYGTGAVLHVVDGAGHLPMVEKPKEVAKILSDFMAS